MSQLFCAEMANGGVICMNCSYKVDKTIDPIQAIQNVAIAYPDGFTCDDCCQAFGVPANFKEN